MSTEQVEIDETENSKLEQFAENLKEVIETTDEVINDDLKEEPIIDDEPIVDDKLKDEPIVDDEEIVFEDDISKVIETAQAEKELAPEVKEALEFKAKIGDHDFIKNYIAAMELNIPEADFLRSVTESSYSENDPERVHRDYLKKQFPTATAEQLEEEWYKFKGGDDDLTLSQKATIRTWSNELNKDVVKPNYQEVLAKKQAELAEKEQIRIAKQMEEVEAYTKSRVGKKVFKIDGKGGFEVTAEIMDEVLTTMEAMSKREHSRTKDNTLKTWVFEKILKATLFDKALPTLLRTTTEQGREDALSKAANMKSTASSSSTASQQVQTKKESPQDMWKRLKQSGEL